MRDELEAIDGIGEKTADKILEIVDDQNNEWLEKAYAELEKGNEERALRYLKRSQ